MTANLSIISELEQLEELKKIAEENFSLLYKTIEHNTDPGNGLREEDKQLLENFVKVKGDIENLKQVGNLMVKKLTEETVDFDAITPDTINDMYDHLCTKVSKNHVREMSERKSIEALEKKLEGNDENDVTSSQDLFMADEELVITASVETFMDPFTKNIIQNPVKNRHCNHYFERDAALNYVGNGVKKCPYVGCDRYMSAKDLVEDKELRQRILNRKM